MRELNKNNYLKVGSDNKGFLYLYYYYFLQELDIILRER
jgi:hypothetical protein